MRNSFLMAVWNKIARNLFIGKTILTNSNPLSIVSSPDEPSIAEFHPEITAHPSTISEILETDPICCADLPIIEVPPLVHESEIPTPEEISAPIASARTSTESTCALSPSAISLSSIELEKESAVTKQKNAPSISDSETNTVKKDAAEQHRVKTHTIGTTSVEEEIPPPLLSKEIEIPEKIIFHPRIQAGTWFSQAEAVVGLMHRSKNLPCQDAAHANAQTSSGRPMVVIADGAGSAVVSELGAQAVVVGMARLVDTLNKMLGNLLDSPNTPTDDAIRESVLILVKHARGILSDTAEVHRRTVKDVRCTLVMAILGHHSMLWLRVGDGALVIQEHVASTHENNKFTGQCRSLGNAGKGEFANETTFLDIAQPSDIQYGCVPMKYISAVAAMSDGASEKLVSNDGSQVAGRFDQIFDNLAQDKLPRQNITKMFYEPLFCEGTTGDDRSLALLARRITIENQKEITTPSNQSVSNKSIGASVTYKNTKNNYQKSPHKQR